MRITKCRICGGYLEPVLGLGNFIPFTFGAPVKRKRLELAKCVKCELVQLTEQIEMDDAYRQYWYRSGLNKSMLGSLQNVVQDIESRNILEEGDTVIDTGCNDGSLFSFYTIPVYKIGYDPAYNLKEIAEKNCDEFINDYFRESPHKAKVITSIAMFYDLPEPLVFIDNVKNSLYKDGVWVVQFTDLLSMFKTLAYDNVCFEHLEYYTLHNIWQMLEVFKLEIFDVSYNDVNGGSIRLFIGNTGEHEVNKRVYTALREEQEYFARHDFNTFTNRINVETHLLYTHVKHLVEDGKTVHILGASTKGITLTQVVFGENLTKYIAFAAEVNEDKIGLDFLGVPIVSESESLALQPDAYLVLPWHFKSTLLEKLKDYHGEIIFPLPEFEIVKH